MDLSGIKILVTGGLGFIGSTISESLVHQGASVRILDNYRTGFDENIKSIKNDVEVLRGSILVEDDLKSALKGVDIVSHQAAQLEITRSIEDPIEDLVTNTLGTLNVFKMCAALGVDRIINASSAGVYGQSIYTPQDEEHPTNPNWAYGVSKLANEKYSVVMQELHGLAITNLRYGIVYGPREWYGRVLTLFLKRAYNNQDLIIFGDGNQVRDFVYVKDVVNMHNACMLNPASFNETFNVATEVPTSINTLADFILAVTERDIRIIYENVAEGEQSKYFERKRLPQELKRLVQSIKKAETLVGWTPRVNLVDGIGREWQWLCDNPHRWTQMNY